jgi:hypothetical protein
VIDRPHYAHGRASAPTANPRRTDYDLIAHLRNIRREGDEAMWAIEEYDPNVGIKLSSCADDAAAERLLDAWLARRVAALKKTQSRLRKVWKAAHAKPDKSK